MYIICESAVPSQQNDATSVAAFLLFFACLTQQCPSFAGKNLVASDDYVGCICEF